MTASLENALIIPCKLKEKFEKFLLPNGELQELNLNLILPFTGVRTEVNLLNFWGININPVISKIAPLAYEADNEEITHIAYHFETESISSEVVGALALAIGGDIEYYHFDHLGGFDHHHIYEFFEAKDGANAYYEVEESSSDIDDICDFFFGKWYDEHLKENCI